MIQSAIIIVLDLVHAVPIAPISHLHDNQEDGFLVE